MLKMLTCYLVLIRVLMRQRKVGKTPSWWRRSCKLLSRTIPKLITKEVSHWIKARQLSKESRNITSCKESIFHLKLKTSNRCNNSKDPASVIYHKRYLRPTT